MNKATGRAYQEVMLNEYTTASDLQSRLDRTICRYEGTPVYVRANGNMLALYEVVQYNKLVKEIVADDPKFDISIMEIGYFNHSGKGVAYATKLPTKQWKAALYSVSISDIGGQKMSIGSTPQHDQGFYDALVNSFPSTQESLEKVTSGEVKEVAISQSVAFGTTPVGVVFVYYKTKSVGWIAPGEKKVNIVNHDYTWVIERLLHRSGLIV